MRLPGIKPIADWFNPDFTPAKFAARLAEMGKMSEVLMFNTDTGKIESIFHNDPDPVRHMVRSALSGGKVLGFGHRLPTHLAVSTIPGDKFADIKLGLLQNCADEYASQLSKLEVHNA
jgi:hypothetical protein